jgi:diguanylate cyclase (GGDEF)-like protein
VERLRGAVESRRFETRDDQVAVTISFGVASTEWEGDLTAERLMGLADEALYSAKESGRNCVHLNTSDGPRGISDEFLVGNNSD